MDDAERKARKRVSDAAYRVRHAAKLAAYREANREQIRQGVRSWRANNSEKANAATRAWFAKNPGYVQARDARKRAVTPTWADHDCIASIYRLAGIYREFGHDVHVDHEVPIRSRLVSGFHTHHNLSVIPALDNVVKGNRHWENMP
jgi:hypothetical protein